MEHKSKKIAIFLGIFTILSIITFYYSYKPVVTDQNTNTVSNEVLYAAELCRNLCIFAKENLSINLNSQCLSDPDTITGRYWTLKNWVCDVANYPRKPIDDLEYNQCEEYLIGVAKNFIEVDPNCTPIRAYYNGKIINLRENEI